MNSFILPAILLLVALRIWRRGGRQRRVRIETMWIAPLVFTLFIGMGLAAAPPPMTPLVIGVLGGALALGLAIGWLRGRAVSITIDTESHTLMGQSSPFGLVLLAAIYLVRQAARVYLEGHVQDWNLSPVVIADGFLVLALGSVVGRRIEILIRCLGLLRAAREAAAAGQQVASEVTQEHA